MLKKKKKLLLVNLHIKSSFKNTIITLTENLGGNIKQWSTKGLKKIKLKKNTPYNIQLITFKLNKYLKHNKIKKMNVIIKGSGYGHRHIIKNLNKKNTHICSFSEITPKPFNGCRKKKRKRK